MTSHDPARLVEQFIEREMGFPPGTYQAFGLSNLDAGPFHFVLAVPGHMSRGGELPFVVEGDRVRAGSHATFEDVVRREGLDVTREADLRRFLGLFFFMAEVGVGTPDGPARVDEGGRVVRATALEGHTGARRTYRIERAEDGHVSWEQVA